MQETNETAGLLQTIDALSDAPLYRNSHVRLLIDGPQTYAAMLAAIASAKSSIHLETYIFGDGEVGRKFARALTERCNAGVAVRVIYDSLGSRESDEQFFRDLEDAGIDVLAYNAVNPIAGGNPLCANNRTHRKLLIVDSRVAFAGGINISQTYSLASSDPRQFDPLATGWRDTHIQVEGPAAIAFEGIFAMNWEAEKGQLPVPGKLPCALPEKCDDVVAVLHAVGGDDEESAIFHAYREAMRIAERRIWITQGYFAPDKHFMDRVIAAAKRGVDVRILVPGFSDTDFVVHASRSRYGRLLRNGVRIYESRENVLHAKTAVIDGTWSTVGSSNLDYRSFLHNDEVNAVIYGKNFGEQMEAQFLADIEQANAVTLADWRKRPLLDRCRELVSRAIEYWL